MSASPATVPEPARIALGIDFDASYANELGDAVVAWQPHPSPDPRLVALNRPLAESLGFAPDVLAGPDGLAVLSGRALPVGARPVAQAYAGHQFGGFSPRLGDGRALLLGEVIDRAGQRRDIAFKGSGRTPFSRGGDGKAALGPALREYVVGEAMHALGIPTTRTLAVVATGEPVFRDAALPGALLTRVAASHLRVGTFQFFSARREEALLRRVADYAIARHDPALVAHPDRYLELLRAVAGRQAALIARWMGVGFIHGVMNTDNMTISGETIDYGPCAFMEAFDPQTVFSSIDHGGRYAWGNQPGIAQWNLARLAEALLPLIDADPDSAVARATAVLDEFPADYERHRLAVFAAKLGLAGPDGAPVNRAEVETLVDAYLLLLETHAVDFTLGFRRLGEAGDGDDGPVRALFGPDGAQGLTAWLGRWRALLDAHPMPATSRRAAMDRANPIVIARNHQVEAALDAAVARDDFGPFHRLVEAVMHPFDEHASDAAYALPAPLEVTAKYRTFCGT